MPNFNNLEYHMKQFAYPIVLFVCVFVTALAPGLARAQSPDTKNQQQKPTPCNECIRIRVGLAIVARGPGPDIEDFSAIQLPDGRFRGFLAGGRTYAIDGDHLWDMGGPRRLVFDIGAPGAYDSCGQWIHHVEQSGKKVVAWVHNETECHYAAHGQTHMSTSLAISNDYGLTWKDYGRILTGTDSPTPNKITGEDCVAVIVRDGDYYAYSGRYRDGRTIVARAPVSDPGPGKWMKYFQGKWDQPGLGGDATRLAMGVGDRGALWTTTGQILMLGWEHGGITLLSSADGMTFTTLREPPMYVGAGRVSWSRPGPTELIAYPVLLDAKTGSTEISNSWVLAYMYVQPNEGMAKRYLIVRPVEVSVSNSPVSPQVGVLLARWYNAKLQDRWSTTEAVPPGNDGAYQLEAKLGFLMTAADLQRPSVELEDCESRQGQQLDHVLAPKGECESHGYQVQRTAGFVYAAPQPGTQPLYSCSSESKKSHFAAISQDCHHLGKQEGLLGYDLKE
jgi:hypothetical protein